MMATVRLIALFVSSLAVLPAVWSGDVSTGFITRAGDHFVDSSSGKPFRFAGTNCYYLNYKDLCLLCTVPSWVPSVRSHRRSMVDDALDTAARNKFTVVRMWGFIDVGYPNGSGSVDGLKDGMFFQYYDAATNRPTYNDTALERLDYILWRAGQVGVRLILTLTNNWYQFGGMDQYVRWREWSDRGYKGLHDDFYVDPTIRGWYKDWVKHLVQRNNTMTGVVYRDDPTIFAWELGNEPRCQGSGVYKSSKNCILNYAVYGKDPVAYKLGQWVAEMAPYIKSLDTHHMVDVGDEGFLCMRYQACPAAWCDCYYGVDTLNFSSVPAIDFMSLHLYPDAWGVSADWGTVYIGNHTHLAHTVVGKPVVLAEFGYTKDQEDVYRNWTDKVYSSGMDGDMFWMLSAWSGHGYDPGCKGMSICCPNATQAVEDNGTCTLLAAHAAKMAGG